MQYDQYYKKNGQALLPVRWMAPECLRDGKFLTESDRWSFGVVMWEVFTLARIPYPGKSNQEVYEGVIMGLRMSQPNGCPLEVYEMMRKCWMPEPKDRPSFDIMAMELQHLSNAKKLDSEGTPFDPGAGVDGIHQVKVEEEYTMEDIGDAAEMHPDAARLTAKSMGSAPDGDDGNESGESEDGSYIQPPSLDYVPVAMQGKRSSTTNSYVPIDSQSNVKQLSAISDRLTYAPLGRPSSIGSASSYEYMPRPGERVDFTINSKGSGIVPVSPLASSAQAAVAANSDYVPVEAQRKSGTTASTYVPVEMQGNDSSANASYVPVEMQGRGSNTSYVPVEMQGGKPGSAASSQASVSHVPIDASSHPPQSPTTPAGGDFEYTMPNTYIEVEAQSAPSGKKTGKK